MFVADIMTENVHTISPSHTLGDVRKIFKEVSYRHLLVEENGVLVGIVSDRDVLIRLSPYLGTAEESEKDRALLALPVEKFMSRKMITVDRQTIIECASILLIENNISCLPVVKENNRIDGILSWKDLLQYLVYGSGEDQKPPPQC